MRAFAVLALLAGLPGLAWAQDAEPPPPLTKAAAEIDATKLGVSLSRIQRQLRIAESREQVARDGFRLEFNVQVYGTAPKIEVLKGLDLFNGPVPGSAPSHQQFLEYVTPQIYRSPTMPVGALAGWVAKWAWSETKKSRCEAEIENYRALLMQGVNVTAPRCTQ